MDGELVADIARGEVAAIPVEGADGEGEALPFDQLLEVELHAEAEVVCVGEALGHTANGISSDVVRVAGGEFHAAVIEKISDAPPVAGEGVSIEPLARSDEIRGIGIVIRPEARVAEHGIRRGVADRSSGDVTRFLGGEGRSEAGKKQQGKEEFFHAERGVPDGPSGYKLFFCARTASIARRWGLGMGGRF